MIERIGLMMTTLCAGRGRFMPAFARHYLLALQYFTRIPITGRLAQWVGFSPALIGQAARHFAGVGLLVGLCAAFVFATVSAVLPDWSAASLVAAAISMAAGVLITGGLHEDGMADLCDGLGGSAQRERALEIMKDARVGAFGVMGLVLSLLCKVALLALLGEADTVLACVALVGAHTVSRAWPVLLMRLLPNVGPSSTSKSKPLTGDVSRMALAVALIWCLPALLLLSASVGAGFVILPLLASGGALLFMWRLLRRRLQGYTGDALGATQQLCEIGFYFGLAVTLSFTAAA